MKKLISYILTTFICLSSFATNYYISNDGNDAAAGTSPSTSWRTITKLNASIGSIINKDSILFKRGNIFFGSPIVKTGLNYNAYGTGERPIITVMTTVTGWSLVSPGLYKARVVAPNDVRYVTIDGSPVEWGRTPNKGLGLASYNYMESAGTRTFTDNELTVSPNRTGHRLHSKGETWSICELIATSHVGTNITYRVGRRNLAGNSSFLRAPKANSGYIWVGNLIDCDQYGEWHYDSTLKDLYMFFGTTDPNTKTVQISTANTLFNVATFSFVSIENLDLRGANEMLVYNQNGSGSNKFINLTLDGSGARGLMLSNTPNITVKNNTARNILSMPFRLPPQGGLKGASVLGNHADATNVPFETMMYNGEDVDGSFMLIGMSNAVIANNKSEASGYHGIYFSGNDVLIKHNDISNYSKWLTDCGGLYVLGRAGAGSYTVYTNRVCDSNYIHDATGYRYGYKSLISASTKGLYNDDQSHGVLYSNNTVAFVDIGCSNNVDSAITLKNNTFIAQRGINFWNKNYNQLDKFRIVGNIMSNTSPTSYTYYYLHDSIGSRTISQTLNTSVVIDSNICNSGDKGYGSETYKTTGGTPPSGYKVTYYNPTSWKSATGRSTNDVIVPYLPFADNGRKLVANWKSSISDPISLPGIFKDYYGNTYEGSITLRPYSTALLYYFGPLTPSVPVINYKIKGRYKQR